MGGGKGTGARAAGVEILQHNTRVIEFPTQNPPQKKEKEEKKKRKRREICQDVALHDTYGRDR